MSIWQRDFEGQNKVDIAVARIRNFCEGKKAYIAFSGGKDSQCCYHLCKLAKVNAPAIYRVTRFEPPQLIQFIRDKYPDVSFSRHYKRTLHEDILKKGLPSRLKRWCCVPKHEKEVGFDVAVIGVRAEESARRERTWRVFGVKQDRTAYVCPIFDWAESDVWEFLSYVGAPHCCLYDPPFNLRRIGCVCCPLAFQHMRKEAELWPKTANMLWKAACAFVDRMRKQNWHTATGIECGSWHKAENPELEYWSRWMLTGQTTKSQSEFWDWTNRRPVVDGQCVFEGSGFSNADAGGSDDGE